MINGLVVNAGQEHLCNEMQKVGTNSAARVEPICEVVEQSYRAVLPEPQWMVVMMVVVVVSFDECELASCPELE